MVKKSPWWSVLKNLSNNDIRSPIQTLIFFDFETTGLFSYDQTYKSCIAGDLRRRPEILLNMFYEYEDCSSKSPAPRITEMSFVSVPRNIFVNAINRMADKCTLACDDLTTNNNAILENISVSVASNVHTCQLNPDLSEEEWENYVEMTEKFSNIFHLKKEELLCKNTFNFEWSGVREFLALAQKPACLIAHNGLCYDNRILLQELRRFDKLSEIPDGVFFLDSYLACLDIEKSHHEQILKITEAINWQMITKLVVSASDSKIMQTNSNNNFISSHIKSQTPSDGVFELNDEICAIKRMKNADNSDNAKKNKQKLGSIFIEPKFPESNFSVLTKQNVTAASNKLDILKRPVIDVCVTPKKRIHSTSEKRLCQTVPPLQLNEKIDTTLSSFNIFEKTHPLRFINSANWSPALRRRLTLNMFRRLNTGGWYFCKFSSNQYFAGKNNFKLVTLQSKIIGGTHSAHRAQDDCKAMLQICLAYGDDFMRYMDAQYARFPAIAYKQ